MRYCIFFKILCYTQTMEDYTPCWKIDLDSNLATQCVKPLNPPKKSKNPKSSKGDKNNGSKSKNRKSSCSG
jgi:hypothetical protein